MDFFVPLIKIVHILVSIILIVVILLQPGKSGDLGSVFGGGTSESVFGSAGAVPFLAKVTRLLAVIFIITSLSLGYLSVQSINRSVIEEGPATEQTQDPASTQQQSGANTDTKTGTGEDSTGLEDLETEGMMQDNGSEQKGMMQEELPEN